MSSSVVSNYERGANSRAANALAPASDIPDESGTSSVSWTAILSGALVAAALSHVLVALGSGLGLMSVSPWSQAGVSAEAVAVGSVVWLCAMQLVSAAAGGYVAGRLRTRWTTVHSHEVYFRDTAHGLLVWAAGHAVGRITRSGSVPANVGGMTARW